MQFFEAAEENARTILIEVGVVTKKSFWGAVPDEPAPRSLNRKTDSIQKRATPNTRLKQRNAHTQMLKQKIRK